MESNPLDEPLTSEERQALHNLVLCHSNKIYTHRDEKALAQVALAAQRYMNSLKRVITRMEDISGKRRESK